ncbi:hypothetical protein JCM10450v2_004011 [Rhodotorula kratochvilovae]
MPPSLRSSGAKKSVSTRSQPARKAPAASNGGAKEVGKGGKKEAKELAPAAKKKSKKVAQTSPIAGRDLFSNLPLDVLRQICGDLDPGTLLAISQVSKGVHRTLASKSSEALWVFVRCAADLPDLREPLSEPKYAFLAQGSTCQVCGSTRHKTEAEHPLRVRACSKCFQKDLQIEDKIRKEHPQVHEYAFRCALSTKYSAAGKARVDGKFYYWVPDVVDISEHLHSLDPQPTFVDVAEDEDTVERYIPNDAVSKYFDERRAVIKRVGDDADTIVDFDRRKYREALHEESEDRKKRYEMLCAKLAAAGFTEKDYDGIPYWARNSMGSDWVRAQRVRQDRVYPLYRQLVAAAPAGDAPLYPRFEAFLDLPSVKTFWEPEGAVVDVAAWTNVKPAILVDIADEMRKDKLHCFDLVARTLVAAGADLGGVRTVLEQEPSIFVDPNDESKGIAQLHAQLAPGVVDDILQRATGVLCCTDCYTAVKMPYVDMLVHLKRRHPSNINASCEAAPSDFVKLLRDALLDAGKDEATTTKAELEDLGAVFDVALKGGGVIRGKTWGELTSGSIRETWNAWDHWRSYNIKYYADTPFASIKLDPVKVKKVQDERDAIARGEKLVQRAGEMRWG